MLKAKIFNATTMNALTSTKKKIVASLVYKKNIILFLFLSFLVNNYVLMYLETFFSIYNFLILYGYLFKIFFSPLKYDVNYAKKNFTQN